MNEKALAVKPQPNLSPQTYAELTDFATEVSKTDFCPKVFQGKPGQVMIAMGAVAPTPIRAVKAEAFLTGKLLKPEIISAAAELAASETNPINDFRASADYRQELVKNLVTRGIHQLLGSNIVS